MPLLNLSAQVLLLQRAVLALMDLLLVTSSLLMALVPQLLDKLLGN
jgi:hypothetical protein